MTSIVTNTILSWELTPHFTTIYPQEKSYSSRFRSIGSYIIQGDAVKKKHAGFWVFHIVLSKYSQTGQFCLGEGPCFYGDLNSK